MNQNQDERRQPAGRSFGAVIWDVSEERHAQVGTCVDREADPLVRREPRRAEEVVARLTRREAARPGGVPWRPSRDDIKAPHDTSCVAA